MTVSDNTAGNLVLKALGGPDGLTRFARELGDPTTRLDRWEVELNEAATGDLRDTTTPDVMVENIRKLILGNALRAKSRDQLTAWFVANKTGDARLRAGLPRNWRVGDRTGTGDNGATNDVAVAWPPGREPIIICVYLTETKAQPEHRNAAIAEVGRSVGEAIRT
jgi:beta-lactamase class A